MSFDPDEPATWNDRSGEDLAIWLIALFALAAVLLGTQ